MTRHCATIAFIIGLIAVSCAAFRNNFMQPQRPVAATKRLTAVAAEAATRVIKEKILHRKTSAPAVSPSDWKNLPLHPYQMIYTSLGLIAIGLGAFSWSRHLAVRLAGAAVALGLVAVAWEWALVGVTIAVVILILANLG